MRYPVVLLDVGGTLLGPRDSFGDVYARVFRHLGLEVPAQDFESGIHAVWNAMPREIPPGRDRYAHYPGGEEEYWLRFTGRIIEQVTGCAPRDGIAEEALALLREAFSSPAAWTVYPDVVPALDRLRAVGARMAVVSNWDSRLPRILEMMGLARYFETLGVSHFEGVEKPNPLLFDRVLERLGVEPGDAVHVGDVPELDREGARAAGVDDVLVDRAGRLHACYKAVPDLSALPDLVT